MVRRICAEVGGVHGVGVPVAIAVVPLGSRPGPTFPGAARTWLRLAMFQDGFGGKDSWFDCTGVTSGRLGVRGSEGGRGDSGAGGGAAFQL